MPWLAGPTHEISHSRRRSSERQDAYRNRREQGWFANLGCVGLGRARTVPSLTAPRALIPLISCVGPVLLSDTLGVSMLVDAINHRMPEGATQTTVLGPFYVRNPPELPLGADISGG